MTLAELIAAERKAVDQTISAWPHLAPKRQRLYEQMRLFSVRVQRQPLPNDVPVSDAFLQLSLRARDLAGVTLETGHWLDAA